MDPDLPPSPALTDPSAGMPPLDRPALLAALRARIGRLERAGAAAALVRSAAGSVPLSPAIDAALPGGGLARAGLHEVLAAEPGAAAGFAALLLSRTGGTVLWIGPDPDAWPPGLARFGLSPAELVLVRASRPAEALWAMEEALRCPAVTGALLALTDIDLTAARRLQLAAEAGGALGMLLRPDNAEPGPSTALTSWRVEALPGLGGSAHALGDPRWLLELRRCRGGGQPQRWTVTWRMTLDRLDTDAEAAPSAPSQRRRHA
jgi:protein ImuA